MAIHKIIKSQGIYFITFTCFNWNPLIKITNGYDLIYKWFDILMKKSHSLCGFVIMPNHLHMLLHYSGGHQNLNTIIGNGKRFIGYDIINRLKDNKENKLLMKLESAVKVVDRNKGKKHELWQNSFDAKECRTEDFVLQKLNYIHNNPCSGKWKLADHPYHYEHSSAMFYLNKSKIIYPVTDYREFLFSNPWQDNTILSI